MKKIEKKKRKKANQIEKQEQKREAGRDDSIRLEMSDFTGILKMEDVALTTFS